MKKHLFITTLALALLAFGCSSDDEMESAPEATVPLLTSFKINNFENSISYLPNGKPEAIINFNNDITNIIYDSNNRISQFGEDNYTYNSSGQLSNISNTSGTCQMTYNSANLLISQNITIPNFLSGGENLTIQRTYTYNDQNQLIEVKEVDNDNVNTADVTKLEIVYSNGRIVQWLRKESTDNGGTFTTTRNTNIVYDSNSNPLRLLADSAGFTSPFVPTDLLAFSTLQTSTNVTLYRYSFFGLFYVPDNNVLNVTANFPVENGSINEVFTYQYDNDYPITAEKITENSNNSQFSTQYFWQYTAN